MNPPAITSTRLLALLTGAVLAGISGSPAAGEAPPPAPIQVSPDSPGRVFEGIGALSAGASSRLLIDYPEATRATILDYLFKPNFGASLHQLKVEIGGEVNSTCGTEPAHARTRGEFLQPKEEYFQRGYEWWLMKEAKARHPGMMFDVLQWGAPPWIGEEEVKHIDPARAAQGARDFTTDPDGKNVVRKALGEREFRFFSKDNAGFIASFIQGAKTYHDLDIHFCGIWNEITYEAAWIKQLRRTLDENGLGRVKIVAADLYTPNRWEIARDIQADPELAKAIHAIGAHYVKFESTPEAKATGKPLYSSEDLSTKGDWDSAKKFARAFNRNYIQGKMTKTIFWSLIDAYYPYLDYAGCGPMRANTPWSGNYDVQPAIWAIAHTTQFVQPGWRYLDGACATTGDDISHVTLVSPNQSDFSILLESCEAKQPRRLAFAIDPRLSGKTLAVWRSTRDRQFERLPDLPRDGGTVVLDVAPGAIYSLTTTTGQSKGSSSVPPAAAFPFPYTDNFESVPPGRQPKYFADQDGAFEIAARPDGGGQCLFQAVTRKGIPWLREFLQPYSLIGDAKQSDYEVSCQARIAGAGSVALGGRIPNSRADFAPGYWFEISADKRWKLSVYEIVERESNGKKSKQQVTRVLAEGSANVAADTWHALALRFAGTSISVRLDGKDLATVDDKTHAMGAAGIMSGWNQAYFDDFAMKPVAAAAPDAAAAQAALLGQNRQEAAGANTHPDAQWFPAAGLGLFIHWGIASVQGEGDLSWCMLANKSWYDATITPNNYYALARDWQPDKLDFDKMIGAAKAAGVEYAVFTTKHHDGFTMWPSDFGDIGTKSSFGGRDIVREYVDACRKHGVKTGFYYSPPDWRFDRAFRSWSMTGKPLDMDHQPVVLPKKPAGHDQRRAELVQGQVRELLTRYGKIDLIWFDGGKGEISNDEVRRLQPGIVVNRRNGGGGDYGDSEGCLPGKRFSGWFESCVTVWPMRKWSYSKEYPQTGAPMTLSMLSILRGWGGNLLANVGPKGDGSVPPEVLDIWASMAGWMKHSGESVHGTKPGPWPEMVNLPVTTRDGAAYLHFLPNLPQKLPGIPAGERKFTGTRQVIPSLPEYSDTAIWNKAARPETVTLLRTGANVPFQYENGTLSVTLPPAMRTDNVDVVKILWAK